jgi:hypothetical protein
MIISYQKQQLILSTKSLCSMERVKLNKYYIINNGKTSVLTSGSLHSLFNMERIILI